MVAGALLSTMTARGSTINEKPADEVAKIKSAALAKVQGQDTRSNWRTWESR